ncbi:hypothetical protein K491DRAFT_740422 [Lophiostoma macrostomum CBS 122681]|uniref:Uncharacterized protein n=1 Tax=Lophiostoma macrostomum CBS 122681 TaxID=1314788 RepID=A0A6A6TFJ8_9PLEO|nr:hypothetical protein K491DRAFT_740422 [Lophiostoma macrostomum CBS 122681]
MKQPTVSWNPNIELPGAHVLQSLTAICTVASQERQCQGYKLMYIQGGIHTSRDPREHITVQLRTQEQQDQHTHHVAHVYVSGPKGSQTYSKIKVYKDDIKDDDKKKKRRRKCTPASSSDRPSPSCHCPNAPHSESDAATGWGFDRKTSSELGETSLVTVVIAARVILLGRLALAWGHRNFWGWALVQYHPSREEL